MPPVARAYGKQVFLGTRHIADAVDELAATLIVDALNHPPARISERRGSIHIGGNAA